MHLEKTFKRPSVVLLVGLCATSLVCEVMRIQSGGTALIAHQAHWDCLARETAQVPRCMSLTKLGPRDDADFCEEAVARCKASRTYDDVDRADARYDMWFRLTVWLRLTLFAGAIGSLAWIGIVKPIRRNRPTTLP
jgi:hypothetical protein